MQAPTLVAVLALALLAGCASAPLTSEQAAPTNPVPAPPCTPASTNNYGTQVNDLYSDGGELWRETNGITGLQKGETCEGPADTRVAP